MADPTISQNDWDAVTQEREGAQTDPPPQTAPPVQAEANTEQQPAPPAQGEKKDDPYAGLHPEVQAKLQQFDQLALSVPQMVNELREARGRIGALQSEWAKAKQASDQPSAAQIAGAAKDPEKWAALKNDFPEWGDGISEFVEARLAQFTGKGMSAEQIEQVVAQRTGEISAALEKQFNERLVATLHRGWKDEVKTPEFNQWFSAQDAATQALAKSDDPMDAIELLDAFKVHKSKPVANVRQERQQRLEQAVTSTKPGTAPAAKSFDQMSPEEQWQYLAQQREKR